MKFALDSEMNQSLNERLLAALHDSILGLWKHQHKAYRWISLPGSNWEH